MKIVITGDSITDMHRNREQDFIFSSYGYGYPIFVQGALGTEYPNKHEVYNRGISGNRSVDLYARIKIDCINLHPDLVSVLIGINDIWHEINWQNGVPIDRYECVYGMFLDDVKKALPDVRFMLLEPFVLHGTATDEQYERFLKVKEYAAVVKKLAKRKDCIFVPLQERLDELAAKNGAATYLADGVHPSVVGAKTIADEWLKVFRANFENAR